MKRYLAEKAAELLGSLELDNLESVSINFDTGRERGGDYTDDLLCVRYKDRDAGDLYLFNKARKTWEFHG